MSDLVEQLLLRDNKSTRQIFEEAYRTAADPSNFTWAHALWVRSGSLTKTIEEHCKRELNKELPHDTPDYYLAGAIE